MTAATTVCRGTVRCKVKACSGYLTHAPNSGTPAIVRKATRFLAVVLLSGAMCACTKPHPKTQKAPETTPGETASALSSTQKDTGPEKRPAMEPSPPPDERGPRAPAPKPPQAAAAALPGKTNPGANSLLAMDRDRLIPPEDFEIGPLALETTASPRMAAVLSGTPAAQKEAGDTVEPAEDAGLSAAAVLGADERAALSAAASFLSVLSRGKAAGNLIAAAAPALSHSLSYYLERGDVPSSFRLGVPKRQENGEIAVNVRLFKTGGSSEGEIYLVREKRGWRVSDFQVDLSRMREKRAKRGDFMPSSYRWLLGS
jgi:hypothetical protein